jgi:hypothetical protein
MEEAAARKAELTHLLPCPSGQLVSLTTFFRHAPVQCRKFRPVPMVIHAESSGEIHSPHGDQARKEWRKKHSCPFSLPSRAICG